MSVKIVDNKERIQELQRLQTANQAFLRFLQLSLQLYFQWGFYSITAFAPITTFLTTTKPDQSHHLVIEQHWDTAASQALEADDLYTQIVLPLCLIWTVYNVLAIIALKCIGQLNKLGLILTGAINAFVCIFIVTFGLIEKVQDEDPGLEIYHRYAPFQVLNCLIVVSSFYFTDAEEPKRFSNSPGNFVWFWLFFAWDWHESIDQYMKYIGIIYLIITLTSVLMLVLELMKGLTSTVKRIIFGQWIFSLILTGLTEVFAIISHQTMIDQNEQESGAIAIGLLEIFMIVNILDMVFWTTGRCFM